MNESPSLSQRVLQIAVTSALFASATVAAVGVAAAFVTVRMARVVVTPPRHKIEDLRVLASTTSSVTLTRTEDSLTPGRYSLWFDQGAGHARIGEIIEVTATSVTRQLLDVDFGTLHAGVKARFSGWFFLGPRELGYPYENVDIPTLIGPAPAWYVPAAASDDDSTTPRDSWAILVHGRGVRRAEGLRAVPVFHEAGYSSLLISYRNDEDAPNSDDHRYSLGDAEWQDVEAAIEFALAHGAREVVLVGWSMGGATVLQAATRSSHPEVIRGIVLDSPVIDWVNVLNFQGAQLRAPRLVRRAALAVISSEWGAVLTGQSRPIDLKRLDFVQRAGELRWPILLMHSDDDGYVPVDGSQSLARLRPDIVTFERFFTARHTKLWNYDSVRWLALLR
jgi:pimeloyl-ACP methyl ester carboxylesterase